MQKGQLKDDMALTCHPKLADLSVVQRDEISAIRSKEYRVGKKEIRAKNLFLKTSVYVWMCA